MENGYNHEYFHSQSMHLIETVEFDDFHLRWHLHDSKLAENRTSIGRRSEYFSTNHENGTMELSDALILPDVAAWSTWLKDNEESGDGV